MAHLMLNNDYAVLTKRSSPNTPRNCLLTSERYSPFSFAILTRPFGIRHNQEILLRNQHPVSLADIDSILVLPSGFLLGPVTISVSPSICPFCPSKRCCTIVPSGILSH